MCDVKFEMSKKCWMVVHDTILQIWHILEMIWQNENQARKMRIRKMGGHKTKTYEWGCNIGYIFDSFPFYNSCDGIGFHSNCKTWHTS